MEERIIVRRMHPDDLDAVVRIDRVSFSAPWSLNSYRYELLENKLAHLWVAEKQTSMESNQIVGSLVAWMVLDEVHIATISVSPQHRRRHIASLMLTIALKELITKGARIAHLEVRKSNTSAQALYRSFGFVVVGHRPQYYHDNREDALLMTITGLGEKYLLWLNDGREYPWKSPYTFPEVNIAQVSNPGKH